jgi:hypothetical protein
LLSRSYRKLFIWRYRVYGFTVDNNGKALSPFYEIVIRHPVVRITLSGGKNFDWYQPLHENGNVLSYPRLTSAIQDSQVDIPDLGEYQLPAEDAPRQQWLLNQNSFVDGPTGSFDLTIESSTGVARKKKRPQSLKRALISRSASKPRQRMLS